MNDDATVSGPQNAEDVPPVETAAWSTPPEPEPSSGGGGFVWLAMAVLLVVAAGVYVLGSVTRAERQTEAAQSRAEQVLKEYDPKEFTDELVPSESIPLADTTTVVPPTTAPATGGPSDPPFGGDASSSDPGSGDGIVEATEIALAFISRVPGDEYGRVGYLDFDGKRHQTQLECARLDRNESGGVCLAAGSGISGSGQGFILDAALTPTTTFGLTTPSRAAISPDGSVVAWTGFTRGHSYLEPGEFATLTQLISVERRVAADLETTFVTYDGEQVVRNADRNYWGVSFVDDDHFYATVGFGETMAIVEGRISNSRLDVVFENATCPEVSPDGSTVVVKEARDGRFQLVAIDVESGDRRDLGENRSVDDQVEWLDKDTIVYGLANLEEGTAGQPVFDIWLLDVEPGSTPRLLVPFADSPAV